MLFLAAAGAGWSTARALETPHQQAAVCRSPLTGVHDPSRLQVLNACATFVGKVIRAHGIPADGDRTFEVTPDPAYASMLRQEPQQGRDPHGDRPDRPGRLQVRL